MDDATRSLLDLWDATGAVVGGLRPDDWERTLPGSVMDVLDLAVHLTGAHYAAPDRLGEAVGLARDRAAHRLADRRAGDRVLGAWCLDMCLHSHDLGLAVDRPIDLADFPAATAEAARLVLSCAPRLLVCSAGARDCALTLRVGGVGGVGGGLERTVHVAAGAPASGVPGTAPDVVEIDPDALVLLLAGRRDAETLRAEGAADWSGPAAAAFVHGARLIA